MISNATSDQWIALHAARQPEKIALQDAHGALAYGPLEQVVGSGAAWLQAGGVRPGDRVGLLGAPSLDWVVAFLSVTRAGAVPVGLNYRETVQCIAQQVAGAGIGHLFVDAQRRPLTSGLAARLHALQGFADAAGEAQGAACRLRPDAASDIGVLLFTGGTTGSSKGVELTHANLLWNCINEVIAGDLQPTDNVLLATALHHSAALNTWLLPHLYLGATATILGDFEPRRWLDFMQRFRATSTFTPPTMIRQILDESREDDDWSSFEKWFSGAGILSEQDRREMLGKCPRLRIYYQYGLTEAGPIVTCLRPEEFAHSPSSIGRPVRHCEVRLRAEDGSDAAPGAVGEILVRGPTVMRGYHGQPAETAKVLKDGWLHTGDLATMDAHGCLIFHDRSKDMIKTGGLNVFSQEVEAVIAAHPAVAEVAVVGLPDPKWGEKVVAVVSLKAGMPADEPGIIAHARAQLASYQVPKAVLFMSVAELPKNYLGKTMKKDLRDLLGSRA